MSESQSWVPQIEKKVVRCCFVCMSGEALFGIQFTMCEFSFSLGLPSADLFFSTFYSRERCPQLFAQVAGLPMLTVHGATGVSLGLDFLQAARILPFLHTVSSWWAWTRGGVPAHSSGHSTTLQTSHVWFSFTPKPFQGGDVGECEVHSQPWLQWPWIGGVQDP